MKKLKIFSVVVLGVGLSAPLLATATGMGVGRGAPVYQGTPQGQGDQMPARPGGQQWGAPRRSGMGMGRGPGNREMPRRGGMNMGRGAPAYQDSPSGHWGQAPARPGSQQLGAARRGGMGRGPVDRGIPRRGGMNMGRSAPAYQRGPSGQRAQQPERPGGQQWGTPRRGGMGMGRGPGNGEKPRRGGMNMGRGPGNGEAPRRGGMNVGRDPGNSEMYRRGGMGMGRGPGGQSMPRGYGPTARGYPAN
jgi:hypothetical protein